MQQERVMTSEEKAKKFIGDFFGHNHEEFFTSGLKNLLDQHAEEQRQMCADDVKREGYRKNYVPQIRDYVNACLNATGDG